MKFRIAALLTATLLAGCRHAGDLTTENGGGIWAVRNTCPMVGVPAATGDITLFDPAGSTDLLVSYTWRIAFQDSGAKYGLAAAISTVIFLMVAVLSLVQMRFTRIVEVDKR